MIHGLNVDSDNVWPLSKLNVEFDRPLLNSAIVLGKAQPRIVAQLFAFLAANGMEFSLKRVIVNLLQLLNSPFFTSACFMIWNMCTLDHVVSVR